MAQLGHFSGPNKPPYDPLRPVGRPRRYYVSVNPSEIINQFVMEVITNLKENECIEAGCSCEGTTDSPGEVLPGGYVANGKEMKILLVDDADNMLLLLSEYLEGFGFSQILTASSANEAFALLTADPKVPASDVVDIILMDINLGGIDGIEACRRIKNDLGCHDVPIIMVTGEIDLEHLNRAFNAGAMDYVTKPFHTLELHVRVESALKLKQAMDAQKWVNAQLAEKNLALKEAMDNIKVLQGLLPICASCKNIRSDSGNWKQMEEYISEHSEAQFSHGICPDCQQKLYPRIYKRLQEKGIRPS